MHVTPRQGSSPSQSPSPRSPLAAAREVVSSLRISRAPSSSSVCSAEQYSDATIKLIDKLKASPKFKEAIEEEGIFRVPGSKEKTQELIDLAQADSPYTLDDFSVHEIASAIKSLIGSTVNTKDTTSAYGLGVLYDKWLQEGVMTDETLTAFINQHQQKLFLTEIFSLIEDLIPHSIQTKMGLDNLCPMFAPRLFGAPKEGTSPEAAFKAATIQCNLLKSLYLKWDKDKALFNPIVTISSAQEYETHQELSSRRSGEERSIDMVNTLSLLEGSPAEQVAAEEALRARFEQMQFKMAPPPPPPPPTRLQRIAAVKAASKATVSAALSSSRRFIARPPIASPVAVPVVVATHAHVVADGRRPIMEQPPREEAVPPVVFVTHSGALRLNGPESRV